MKTIDKTRRRPSPGPWHATARSREGPFELNESERDVAALRRALAAELPPPPAGAKGDLLEARARRYLQALRWPETVECPRCDETDRLLWLESRSRWNSYACRYQFSVTAGTLFHGSHLPVWKWLVAVRLMAESDGVSAHGARGLLGGSYKTWWLTTHRVRVAIGGSVGAPDATRARRHHRNRYRMAYVNEQRWRARHGDDPAVFRDTVRALLEGEGVSYEKLTGRPAQRAGRRAAA